MDNIGQTMVDKAEDMDSCIDIVHSEPAAQDTKAKGQAKGVPQLGEPFGPLIVESGWATGWKVWVGDLPGNIDKVDIGRFCPGQCDVCVNNKVKVSACMCSDHLRELGQWPRQLSRH